MKITFEGNTVQDLFDQMESVLASSNASRKIASTAAVNRPEPEVLRQATAAAQTPVTQVTQAGYPGQGPGPDIFAAGKPPGDKPVDKSLDKSLDKPGRTPKQLENDERLRVAAKAKVEAKRAAKAEVSAALEKPLPPLATAEGMDPAEVVRVRQKTIEDLQSAYANGHQQEVFELLSRFGNGAKSFRELPPEAFMPIRQAIDNGALT